MHDIAAQNQQNTKEYLKEYHDCKAEERNYEVGSKVLVYAPVVSGKHSDKFTDRWHGPYIILGKVSPVTCVVDMPEKHKRHRTVHVEALKACIEPSLPLLHLDISVESTLIIQIITTVLQKQNQHLILLYLSLIKNPSMLF